MFGFMKRKVWDENWCRKHAQKGDFEAMHSYYIAIRVKSEATVKEEQQALIWLKESAEAGYEPAMDTYASRLQCDNRDDEACIIYTKLINSDNLEIRIKAYKGLAFIHSNPTHPDNIIIQEKYLLKLLELVQRNREYIDEYVDACISLGVNYEGQYHKSNNSHFLTNACYCYFLIACYNHERSPFANKLLCNLSYNISNLERERWTIDAQDMAFSLPHHSIEVG